MSLTRVTIGSFLVGIAITCFGFAASKYPIPWAPWLYLAAYLVGVVLVLVGGCLLALAFFDKIKHIANGSPPDLYFDAADKLDLLPGRHPPDYLPVLQISDQHNWGGIAFWTGSEIRPRTLGIKCVVQNEGDSPLLDVTLTLDLIFKNAHAQDPIYALFDNKIAFRDSVHIRIKRLEPGSGGKFEFWIVSNCVQFHFEAMPRNKYEFERKDSAKTGRGRVVWRKHIPKIASRAMQVLRDA